MEPSLQAALQEVTLAIKDDTEGNYSSAYQHYTASLNKFYEAHKLVEDAKLKEIIQEKMTEYKKRASALKEILTQEAHANPSSNTNNTTNVVNQQQLNENTNTTTANNSSNKKDNLKPANQPAKETSNTATPDNNNKTLKTSQPVPDIHNPSPINPNNSIHLQSSSTSSSSAPSSPSPVTNTATPATHLSFKWPLQSSSNPTKRSCVSIRLWHFLSSFSSTSPSPSSSSILPTTTRSCFLLWWLQAPTGSYVFEITNFQSQTPSQSSSATLPSSMNTTFTVSPTGHFKKSISTDPNSTSSQQLQHQTSIQNDWKALVEIWINTALKSLPRINHQGKNCVVVHKEVEENPTNQETEDKDSKESKETKPKIEGGSVYEGILEAETMRPHEIGWTQIRKETRESGGDLMRVEKRKWVWDWKDVLERNMEHWETWEEGDRKFEESVERDLRDLGGKREEEEEGEVEDEEEEEGGKEVEVSNNVVMGEIVQMRYEMSVMRQEIKDLKGLVGDLVSLLNKDNAGQK